MSIKASQVKELRDKIGVGMMDAKKALVETDGDMDAAIDYLREKGMAKAAKKSDRIAAEGLTTVKVDGNTAVILEVNAETDFVAKNDKFLALVDKLANAILKAKPSTQEEAMKVDVDGKTIEETILEATTTIGEKITFRRFEVIEKEDAQVFGDYEHMGGNITVLTVVDGGNVDAARNVAMHVAALNPQFTTRDDVPQDKRDSELEILKEQAKNEGKPEHIVEKMVEGRLNKWLSEISLTDQPYVKDQDQTVEEYLATQDGKIKTF